MIDEIEIASLVCSVKSSLRNPCTFKGNAFHNFIFNATLRQLNQLFGAYPSHNPFNMVLCIVEPLNHSQPKKVLARLIKTLSSVIGCAAAFLVIVIALGGAICRRVFQPEGAGAICKIIIFLFHEIKMFHHMYLTFLFQKIYWKPNIYQHNPRFFSGC